MKIVFIGGRDIKVLGGIENYMYNLASQLVRMGHEPIVFCESSRSGEEWINGFRVIHMTGPKSALFCKPWIGFKATIKTIFSIKGADFIHYNAWPPSLSSPVARLFGIRSLMQGHGHEWQRSKYSHSAQKIMKFMEMVTAHLNRNLIMCSDQQTLFFKEHYGRTTTTIPTAINLPDTTRELDSDVLERFGLTTGKYFLFLARLVQDKNPDVLIKAFKAAKANGHKLVIAGANPSMTGYVRHLHELAGDCPDIIFTGAVYGNDKEQLLRNAFVFCIPSTIEGLSISLLEAMSYRLPVIASDIPANREVLADDTAFWCKAEDVDSLTAAIGQAAAADPSILKEQTERNYATVINNYTWEKVAEKYVRTVKRFLGI